MIQKVVRRAEQHGFSETKEDLRVDLVTSLTGVSWGDVSAGKVAGKYGDIPVNFIGRRELIANKRACGRKKDLADLEALGEE